ncbi:MAG TPA: hypothetical protein VKU01_29240 [Bryobacteraceae bacterium]|nr:hypothetical protein [Bryobacteraceae bacterium]
MDDFRAGVSRFARSVNGSHYVHGGAGNVPGEANGTPKYPTRVTMRPQDRGLPRPCLFAAECESNYHAVCAGRSSLYRNGFAPTDGFLDVLGPRLGAPILPTSRNVTLEQIGNASVVAVLEQNADQYLWPRPNDRLNAGIVWGEDCRGKRHFDCIGLINWLLWMTCRFSTDASIARYRARAPGHPRHVIALPERQPGDLLIRNPPQEHIGVVIDGGQMAEAASTTLGVHVVPFGGHWDLCYRLDSDFFLP